MQPTYPIFRPTLGEAERLAADRMMRSGWIAQAAEVAAFEAGVAELLGVDADCVVAVSSGTAALHLALLSAGIGPGDEVLVPALGFIATANAVTYCGATPVFVDCDQRALTAGAEHFASAVTPRTRAVIPVHNCGRMAPMDAICSWASEQGLSVIEDAAPAIGAHLDRRAAGTWGDFGCFSLHSSKPITAGEGGLVVAPTAETASRARCLRFHGASVFDFTDVDFSAMWEEEYPAVGFNYRMTDLQAAIGAAQLEQLGRFRESRRAHCERYDQLLAGTPGISVGDHLVGPQATAWQQYVVQLEQPDRAARDAVLAGCRVRGAFAMPGVSFLPAQPAFGPSARAEAKVAFPGAARSERSSISIPLWVEMSEADTAAVAAILIDALTAAGVR